MNLNDYIKSYTEYAEYIDLSANSIHTYIENVIKFFNAVDKNVEDIRKSDINLYLMKYKDGHAYSTLELMVRSLSSFYNVIIDELQLVDMVNPMVGIKLPRRKEEQEHHIAISKDDIIAIIRHAKNVREKAMIMLYFTTGIRYCELSNITLEQYQNRVDGKITLEVTKGSKERDIYISDSVASVIDEYINTIRKDGKWLFMSNQSTQIDGQSFSRTLKCLARRAGLDDEIVVKISNHCLRSSFASYNINNGTPVAVVAKAMGHKSGISVVLNNYYHENKEDVKNMMLNMVG